jgi:hypothetical protein
LTGELVKWTRPQGILTVKQVLTSALRSDAEKLVYNFSDGRSSQEVAKVSGVSFPTVTVYWKRWSTLGIVDPMKVQGGTRYRRIFSLEDVGIDVPRLSTHATQAPEQPVSPVELENV